MKGWNVIQYRCQQTQNIFRDSIFGHDKSRIQMLINEVDLDHPKQVMPWIVRKNVYWILTTIVDDKNSIFDQCTFACFSNFNEKNCVMFAIEGQRNFFEITIV